MFKKYRLGWSLIWSAAPIPNPVCFSILLYADKVALLAEKESNNMGDVWITSYTYPGVCDK